MKTNKVIVTKSLDPQWVRFLVIVPEQESLWFYSEKQAQAYADAVNNNELSEAERLAKECVQ